MDVSSRIIEKIVSGVNYDRENKVHTNFAYPIDEELSGFLNEVLYGVNNSFPDCRVYVTTMVRGKSDKKTYIEERVRKDLKKFVENPQLSLVVDWASLMA
jgi:hypothetical protein